MKPEELVAMLTDIDYGYGTYGDDNTISITDDISSYGNKEKRAFKKYLHEEKCGALELDGDSAVNYPKKTWDFIFAALKECGIKKFKFSNIPLYKFNNNKWKQLFNYIKTTSINSLTLSSVDLLKMSEDCLNSLFEGIKYSNIEELELAYNILILSPKPKEFFLLLLDKISTCSALKTFKLNSDMISLPQYGFFKALAEKIPFSSIKHLALDELCLNNVDKKDWLAVCEAFKAKNIASLSLQDNHFYYFSLEQWQWFFAGLNKTNIQELNIRESHPMQLTGQKWQMFIDGLKSTNIIDLKYEKQQFTTEQQKEIQVEIASKKAALLDPQPLLDVTNLNANKPDSQLTVYRSKLRSHANKRNLEEPLQKENRNPIENRHKKAKLCP